MGMEEILESLRDIPRDEEDSSFVKSFDVNQFNNGRVILLLMSPLLLLLFLEDEELSCEAKNMVEFFEKYGFVVIRNVFNSQESEATRDSIWNLLETEFPELCRNDPKTWSEYKTAGIN